MKIINFRVLIFSLFFLSTACKTYNVYVSIPNVGEDDVFGYQLEDFFNNKKNIKKFRINNTELFFQEFSIIKDSLNKCKELPISESKMGMYKYAFIVSKDTFYSNENLIGWKYKNKICRYEKIEPIILNEIISKR